MYELTLLLRILSCSCRRKRFRWVCRRLRSDRGLAHTRWSPSHSALRCTDRCNCRRNLRRTRRTAYFMQNDCKTRSRRWDIARKMSASKQSAAFISATHKTNKQTNWQTLLRKRPLETRGGEPQLPKHTQVPFIQST